MRIALIPAVLGVTSAAVAGDATMFVFPVPAVTISAGDMLSDELIVERKLAANAAALRMYHTSRAGIAGKVARRTIPAGSAIPVNALRDAYVFREGERVTLELAIGGLSIRGTGVALQPGIVGQTIRVRNIDTGVIVSGVVRSDGSVEVGGS